MTTTLTLNSSTIAPDALWFRESRTQFPSRSAGLTDWQDEFDDWTKHFGIEDRSWDEPDEGGPSRRLDELMRLRAIQSIAREEILAARFHELADEWKSEAAVMSSPTAVAMLPAYQQIIGMGQRAVPLILEELRVDPDLWFWALKSITGVDPVPSESAGNIDEMSRYWVEWGVAEGLIDADAEH
jgi:hypothetical protein